MQRVLALLLSVVFVTAAAVGPMATCRPGTTSLGNSDHECCGDQAISAAPVGACCVVSQGTRDRTFLEARTTSSNDRQADIAISNHAAWLELVDHGRQQRHSSPPPAHVRAVPIYLQQLSLLL